MKTIYYYEADKLLRYDRYASSNPHLSIDEIIWQVNANLDLAFYSKIFEISDTTTHPLIVNKYFKLPDNFIPQPLFKIPNTNFYAKKETVNAFLKLKRDASLEHLNISVLSAYRSIAYQHHLYHDYLKTDSKDLVDSYSARPGHSEHHTGYALDVCVTNHELDPFENTPESNWIIEHAHRYGFIVRYLKETTHITGYKYEPWHLTYVGTHCAHTMKQQQIQTLEEYKVKYIDHASHK